MGKHWILTTALAMLCSVLFVVLFCLVLNEKPLQGERIPVGIKVGEEGYYELAADTSYVYYNGTISEIYLDNVTLLAFKVSEKWEGGAMVYDYSEIETIIQELREKGLDDIADRLEEGLLLTQAST